MAISIKFIGIGLVNDKKTKGGFPPLVFSGFKTYI
jgi:hypothetical protein